MNAYEFEVAAKKNLVKFLEDLAAKAYLDHSDQDPDVNSQRWREATAKHDMEEYALKRLVDMTESDKAAFNAKVASESRRLRTAQVKADLCLVMKVYDNTVNEIMLSDKPWMHKINWDRRMPDYELSEEQQVAALALFMIDCFTKVTEPKLKAAAVIAVLNVQGHMRKFW